MNITLPECFFVFDVESIGLHGEPFAVGYVVINKLGEELAAKTLAVFPHLAHGDQDDREWVEANVPDLPTSHGEMREMLKEFWGDWLTWKERGALMFAECSWPVEAKFLAMCIGLKYPSSKWEGPYPLHDISSVMWARGMDPMQSYVRLESERPAHHPLMDARQSARLLIQSINRTEV